MDETYLLTVDSVYQVGDDLLLLPSLPADKYHLGVEKVKIIKPDNQIIDLDAEFSIPFTTPTSTFEYWMLIPNAQKDEVPVGSQVWVYKTLEEITRPS